MVDEPRETHGPLRHPEVRYERTDMSLRLVLIVTFVASLLAAFTFWIVWTVFQKANAHESAIKQSAFPLAATPNDRLPAEPRLEPIDRLEHLKKSDVSQREAAKEAILNSTGPTAAPGFVHIPIERAMKLVVQELPVRTEPRRGPARDNGLLDDGAPNSGRVFREAAR